MARLGRLSSAVLQLSSLVAYCPRLHSFSIVRFFVFWAGELEILGGWLRSEDVVSLLFKFDQIYFVSKNYRAGIFVNYNRDTARERERVPRAPKRINPDPHRVPASVSSLANTVSAPTLDPHYRYPLQHPTFHSDRTIAQLMT
jgi:hypothetical protein